MQNPARGPWNLVLSVRSFVWAAKEPLKEPCCCLRFPLTELSLLEPLAVCNPPAPKPSSRTLGTKCKGKAGVELKPERRQWHFPASHSLLLPGEGA